MIETILYPTREQRRGEGDYLPKSERDCFCQKLIKKIESRGTKMTRSDTWYLRYYHEPYLATLTGEQYKSRWADIQDNLIELTPDLKIGMCDPRRKPQWIECFTDLLAESQFRGGIPSDLEQGVAIQTFAKNTSGLCNHIDRGQWDKNYIFKFGNMEHIKEAIENEHIRFVRSGRYSSTDMNRAQQDEENNFTFSIMPVFLKNLDGMNGISEFDRSIFSKGLNLRVASSKDYLVWCASASYDPRLPYAFEYNSVLVIKDKKRFEKTLKKEIQKLNAEWSVRQGRVKYLDPYLEAHSALDIPFAKHFRFSYQNEYRTIVESENIPEEVFIDVPNLSEYSSVYKLY